MQGEEPSFWEVRQYEYLDPSTGQWVEERPAACGQHSSEPLQEHAWHGGSPKSEIECKGYYCIYRNLWFNNGHFYLITDPATPRVRARPRIARVSSWNT
jgi:hypothetical protein